MSFGARAVGHWRRLTEKGLKDFGPKEWSKIRGMLLQMGYATEKEIKLRIKHRQYKINHPFTVEMKSKTSTFTNKKGKTITRTAVKDQPLVETGQLNKSIRTTAVGAFHNPAVFAGVLKTARSMNGKNLYRIAKIVHYGKVIRITPNMRAFLLVHGFPLKPTTKVIRIPPRRFISDVVNDPIFLAKLKKFTASRMTQILMER